MARWHLDELRAALARRGWRVARELAGNGRDISGVWELARVGSKRVTVEFEGLDDLEALPIACCYAARVRGRSGTGLYFGRRGVRGSRRHMPRAARGRT